MLDGSRREPNVRVEVPNEVKQTAVNNKKLKDNLIAEPV